MVERQADWTTASPAGALMALRVIWGALLFGQVALLAVVVVLRGSGAQGPGESVTALFWLDVAFLGVAIAVGSFVRGQIYKRHWVGDVIMPRGYVLGNVVLLALLEAASIFGLLVTLLHGRLMPTVIPTFIAMGLQAINFPTGAPMRPSRSAWRPRAET